MKALNRAICSLLIIYTNFCFPQKTTAQSAAFDSARLVISSEIAALDVNKAIAMADSLLDASQTDLERTKCFMLRATLEDRLGNKELAIKYAVACERLAKKAGLYEQQLRSAGFLSNLFLNIGLITEARKYLNIVEANNRRNPDSVIQLLIYQQKAFLALGSKDYERAKEEITKAQHQLDLLRHKKNLHIDESLNYWIKGLANYNTKNYAEAEVSLQKAKECLVNRRSELKGFIFQAQAAVYIATKSYAKARKELDTALVYLEGSNNFVLRMNIYETLCLYYEAIGDTKNALIYQKLYTTTKEQFVQKGNAITNTLLSQYNTDISRKNNRTALLYWLSGLLVVLTITIFCYNLYYRRKQRKLYLNYIQKLNLSGFRTIAHKQITNPEEDYIMLPYANENDPGALSEALPVTDPEISSLDTDELDPQTGTNSVADNDDQNEPVAPKTGGAAAADPNTQKTTAMSLQMEDLILKGLLKLEDRKFFLKPEMNLTWVASKLKVNTRYVSLVINKHKKKDFKNYINELRVNYIIMQLKNHPEYLEYKISYLANEAGFPSHSKFATVFKSITGMPPSSFIENIRKDNKRIL